ncbi:preprotein translocase subunit SecE [Candidatus Parcubacteria bacterium]|nr:MAG: preprotein translocase subunit SecE [Candidatus Parcubacteria bacterium]
MANGFTQYLRDTRAELRHVAWPTRAQTIVYSVLVAVISVVVAIYLGLFDFLFTSSLGRFVEALPVSIPTQQEQQIDINGATSTIQLIDANVETGPIDPEQ